MKNKFITVVIPTYNGQALLAKHLPKVAEILVPGDEIIVVDDASTDETISWLESQIKYFDDLEIDLRWIHHIKNKRFAAAVNSGVELAAHPYILLLNNDVTPLSPDLRQQLLAWFENEDTFAVGCAEVTKNTPDAQLYGRGTGDYQRGLLVHWYEPDQKQYQTLWTAGGSMMFDKAKFNELGGFDTLFYPAYEEDRDLSYRALKHGWSIFFEHRARVWHQHESTNLTVFGKRQMITASWKNQFLLVWKNISDPRMLIEHLAWLPYHLIVTNWRTAGAVGVGFWRALRHLPIVWQRRITHRKFWHRTDREVLALAKQAVASPPPLQTKTETKISAKTKNK